MVGFVIATHGKFAEGLMDAVDLIMGEQENTEMIGLHHGDDVSQFGDSLADKVKKVSTGDGVIVFADLFGASPYNQAALCSRKIEGIPYKLITGVSLPMLVQAFNDRMLGKNIEEIKASSMEAGKKGIIEFFDEMQTQNK
ncbi:PTS sugar transporter subunit IIA [Loigolactobacillus iwatensis]|uniref:PTS sugar transporter subunit IIA n=1 Tax=Loigolactobacillus iwatensis TaxID=1267156 RepID=UPI000F7EF9A8|nr:PTS sugar transporter subunit IIA [Loigolactobacillus iwatensis]